MASRKQLSPLARHYEAEAAKRVAEVEAKAKAEREALVETMQLRLSDAQAAARSAEAELGKIKDATTAEIEEQAEKKWKGALRASVRKYRSQIKDLQAELDAAQAEAEAATSSAAGPNPAMMQLLAKQKAKSRAARETALAKQEVKLNRLAKQKSDVLRSSQKSLEQSLAKAKSQLALRGKSASRGSTGSTSSPANRRRSVDRAIVEHEKALRSVKAENEAALADLRKQLSRDVAKAEVKTRKEMMRKAKKLVATATEESAVAETLRAALADGTSKLQSKTEELIQTHDAHAAALEMADREHLEVLAARIEESEEQLRSVHAAYEQQLVASSKATSTAKTSAKRHTEKLKSEHETAVEELRVTYEREVVAAAKKESLVLKRRQSSALSKRDAKHEAQLEGRIAELVAAHSAALVQQQKSSREAERKTQASANRRVSQAKKLASTAMEESDAKIAEFKAAAHKTNEEHLVTVRSEARRKSRLVLKRQGDAHAELLATLKNESTAAMEKVERELAQRHRKAQLKTNVQHKTERIRLSDELEESAHVASLLKDSIAATTKSAALALRRAKEELMLEKAMAAEHSTALDSVSSLFDEAKVSHAAAVQSLEETHAAEAAKLVASHNDVVSSVRLEHDAQESAAAEALVKLKEAAAAHELLISERDTLQDRHDSAHASAREAKVQHSAAVVQSALELSAVRDAARVKLARETSELAAAHSEIEAKRTAAHAAELNAALAEENARSEDAMAALVKTHESKVAKDARKSKNETTQAVRAAVSEVEKTTAASEAERHELLVKKHAGALRKLRREENSRAEARHAVAANKFKRELAEMEAEAVRGKDAAVKTLNSKHRRAVDHLRQDFDLTLSKELDDAADNHKRVLTEQKRLAEKSKAAAVHTLRTSMEQRIEDHELRTSSSTETKVALERKLKSVQAEYEEQLVAAEAAALSKQTSVDETERLQRELVVLRADTVRSQEVALDEYRAAEEEARNAMVENHANAVVKKQSKIDEKQSEIEGLQLQLEEETALQLELAATAEAERVRATDDLARAMKDAGAKFETRLKKEVRSAVRVAVAAQAQKHRHDKASSSSGAAAELDALRAELEEVSVKNSFRIRIRCCSLSSFDMIIQ